MPNSLTGDFEAVLQVSGGTINRLLASLHQNAFENPKLPSFPHSVRMRIGDDHAYHGVRGVVHAQNGVPRVELLHGATDRFLLEVDIRAWYRPDPGTEPMPAYIHGTVRAEYQLHAIDPNCFGWRRRASDYLWFRVVRDSVRFIGTAEHDLGDLGIAVIAATTDAAADNAQITQQIARLLARRFEATPHRAEKGFRRGSLRSLHSSAGGSAIALPISLTGGDPVGAIATIDNLLLGGADLAVGVSRDYILSLTAPMLKTIKDFQPTYWVHVATGKYNPVPDFDTVYRVSTHLPTVVWEAHGTHALITIRASGRANSDSVIAPNVTFDITQPIVLDFDAGARHLRLSPLAPVVVARAGGPFGGLIEDRVKNEITSTVKPIVAASCNAAQSSLDGLTMRTDELSRQLRSLDDQATASFNSAEFVVDGMVLRGAIRLAPRRGSVVMQEKTAAGDGHSALECWIPGGRIDRFEWSWTWAGSGEPGNATLTDRFLLRRPRGSVSRWGMAVGLRTPLPGLDGDGRVCLKITGVQVNPVTGQLETVISSKRCTRFGFPVADLVGRRDRLFLRDLPELSQDVPFPQLADLPVVAARRGEVASSNVLLIHAGSRWDRADAETLAAGLDACRRYDAGLSVLVLVQDGRLDHEQIGEADGFFRRLGVPGRINEDVGGRWAQALEMRSANGKTGWAIITPDGHLAWAHHGGTEAAVLASALDTHLRRSPDTQPTAFHPGVTAGALITGAAFRPGIGDLLDDLQETTCPPFPLARGAIDSTVVSFVQKNAPASEIHLRRLAARHAESVDAGSTQVVIVVDGAEQLEAQSLQHAMGLDCAVLGDVSGAINDRFAIGIWPTTLLLDASGVVADVQVGVASARDDHPWTHESSHDCYDRSR